MKISKYLRLFNRPFTSKAEKVGSIIVSSITAVAIRYYFSNMLLFLLCYFLAFTAEIIISLGHDEGIIFRQLRYDERINQYPEKFRCDFIRFSVGLEDPDNIILDQALKSVET